MIEWSSNTLPPAQLYIVLGIMATACAVVSARMSLANAPQRIGMVVVAIFCASVFAVLPVLWNLHNYLTNWPWDDNAKKAVDESYLYYMTALHSLALVVMFILTCTWLYVLCNGRYKLA